jgi:glycerol-3-phosphate acyltransferase PlsY
MIAIVAGFSAIAGHIFTCWLKFKGGKGIATSCGVYFALAPLACALSLGLWILTLAVTRYVSVASIIASVGLPFAVALTQDSLVLTLCTVGVSALAIYKHKSNIQRLLNGTEHRVGRKDPATPPA